MKRATSTTTSQSNPWDEAKKRKVLRGNGDYPIADLEPGVKFFVLMLEQLGATTIHSCEGHPHGFYVSFRCSYATALSIQKAGFFGVSILWADTWKINPCERLITSARTKAQYLRQAATHWEERLGKLQLPQGSGESSKTFTKAQ